MKSKFNRFIGKVDFKYPPNISYVKRLTTPTGIIQHAKYAIPDRKLGYTLDDNSRAFVAIVWCYVLFKDASILDLALTYLSFIFHARTNENDFYNFLSFDHHFLDEAKSQDSFGRAFWSLGFASYSNIRRDITLQSKYLAAEVFSSINSLTFLRAKSYTILGLSFLCQMEPQNSSFLGTLTKLSDDLLASYEKNSSIDWQWFENAVTYGNGIFPYSLIQSYKVIKKDLYLEVAKKTLNFLHKISVVDDKPSPIGQNGWYSKENERSLYDQQAIDPAYMVLANCAAYQVTRELLYKEDALFWFSWFHGNNLKNEAIYDEITAGCFDGLTPEGVNLNQGAESIVCYLLAYLAISETFYEN